MEVIEWNLLSIIPFNLRSIQATNKVDSLPALTSEESIAFDALNSLQRQLGGRLYSTFVGSAYPCLPPDNTFTISRAELMIALQQLRQRATTDLSIEQSTKLITEAVLAQEEYVVEQCYGFSTGLIPKGIKITPTSGTWVLRSVLARRDVILNGETRSITSLKFFFT